MGRIISVGTADAPYKLNQSDVKKFIYNLLVHDYTEVERLITVFDNSNISRRHFSVDLDWLSEQHTFSERNEIFKDVALELSEKAINECLEKAGAEYSDINNIIYVTSTGLTTPTLDAILFNKLKFNRHIKRTPLWGLGCAAGASAVSKAMDYLNAHPAHNVLVLAIELCSLTFQKDDLSKSNVVATSLFSDGCAALFAAGSQSKYSAKGRAELVDSMATIYEDSLDVMGWDIVNDGFKVVFSRDIPAIVKEFVNPNINELISRYGLTVDDIKHYVTHPGGMKVINAYVESLGLTNGKFDNSKKVLNEHGNMSSPSVLYVLKEFLAKEHNAGEYGLISALGPGFSSELVLFKTL